MKLKKKSGLINRPNDYVFAGIFICKLFLFFMFYLAFVCLFIEINSIINPFSLIIIKKFTSKVHMQDQFMFQNRFAQGIGGFGIGGRFGQNGLDMHSSAQYRQFH